MNIPSTPVKKYTKSKLKSVSKPSITRLKRDLKSPISISNKLAWKPITIPPEFTLVIDTREQQPMFRKPPKGLEIVDKKLDNGDYSVLGFEDKIFIERKKLSDLLSYIGRERKVTVGKLTRIIDYEFKGLIIECDEASLFAPQIYSKVTKEMVEGFLLSFEIRFGGHYKCSKYRSECERWILNHAVYAYNRLRLVQ